MHDDDSTDGAAYSRREGEALEAFRARAVRTGLRQRQRIHDFEAERDLDPQRARSHLRALGTTADRLPPVQGEGAPRVRKLLAAIEGSHARSHLELAVDAVFAAEYFGFGAADPYRVARELKHSNVELDSERVVLLVLVAAGHGRKRVHRWLENAAKA